MLKCRELGYKRITNSMADRHVFLAAKVFKLFASIARIRRHELTAPGYHTEYEDGGK